MVFESGDEIREYGGELWHCFRQGFGTMLCLGYWCPCWLFGRNLQQSGVCPHVICGCMAYLLFSAVVALSLIAAKENFLVHLDLCYEEKFTPCTRDRAISSDGPCQVWEVQTLLSLRQMTNEGTATLQEQAWIALEVEIIPAECLECFSSISPERAVDSEVYCNMLFVSHQRMVELGGLVAMGLFGGLFRERIRRSLHRNNSGATRWLRWWSFGLHCCPISHQLALCQEGRAIATSQLMDVAVD